MHRFITHFSLAPFLAIRGLAPCSRKPGAAVALGIALMGSLLLLPSAPAPAQARLNTLWLMPAAQAATNSTNAAQYEQRGRTLELSQPIKREIAGGETHSYSVNLKQGQFLHAVVVPRGVDLAVRLYGSGGERLLAVDMMDESEPEPVIYEVEKTGTYRLEVRPVATAEARGRYEIVGVVRYWQSLQIVSVGRPSDYLFEHQKAQAFRSQALLGKQATGDRKSKTKTLIIIGNLYDSLGENQKALEFYRQAQALAKTVNDRSGEARALTSIGSIYGASGEQQKQLEFYNQALSLARAAGDREGEADTLLRVACPYIGQPIQERLDAFNQTLPLKRAVGDRSSEIFILVALGSSYHNLREKQKALEVFNQARSLARAVDDRRGEASALARVGTLYEEPGEYQKQLESYDQALALTKDVGDRRGEADILMYTGNFYLRRGDHQKAREFFDQALSVSRSVGDRREEATTLYQIGYHHHSNSKESATLRSAIEKYEESLPHWRAVADRYWEADALGMSAFAYSSLGEYQNALDYYNQALTLLRAISNRRDEAIILNNMGRLYVGLGEYQNALDYLSQALPLRRAVGDRYGEAYTLNNTGLALAALGEHQKALDYYNQALPLRRAANDPYGEVLTLNNIGLVYVSLGEQQKALDYFNQALPLCRAVSPEESNTLHNIGLVYVSLGEQQKALDYYHKALPISRTGGYRADEAALLIGIGAAYGALGEQQKALDDYYRALALYRSMGSRQGEAVALYKIARAERERGNLDAARTQIEAALAIIESLRTKIISQELRASYLATVQDYYKLYADLLMRLHKQHTSAGHDAAALQVSERGRARWLLDTLAEAGADIRQGVDPKLVERERSLQRQLNGKALFQTKLLSGAHTAAQSGNIAGEIETLTTELQQLEAQIRQTSPRYAALTQPVPLSLTEIQQLLDADTLLLEYELGEERSYLWAVTPTSINSYELPKRAEVEARARRVYDLLTARNQRRQGETAGQKQARLAQVEKEFAESASRLSEMVLAPVAAQLGTKRLLIVSDGALQYLPFAALPAPGTQRRGDMATRRHGDEEGGSSLSRVAAVPLVVEHEIVNLPSASVLAALRRELSGRRSASRAVAVLADPVFDKDDWRIGRGAATGRRKDAATARVSPRPRVSASMLPASQSVADVERAVREAGMTGAGIPRLTYSRREAEAILAAVPRGAGLKALDFQASRATAMSAALAQYRIIHFATHGLLNSAHPKLSGIVLSLVDEQGQPVDGFLRLHEIYNLKLPADLVVLSACQTGLGKEIKGEGLVGLTRGFMYAGAPRVVASLWKVDDAATAELMERFYRRMLREGLRPAAALRAAQVEMWQQKRWRAPYYWAAFVLQGEWK